MNADPIAKFCETQKVPSGSCLKIDFKKRNSILGYFIQTDDYEYLKTKNLWRFVILVNIAAWRKTSNIEMAKIFNGSDFTRITMVDLPVNASYA